MTEEATSDRQTAKILQGITTLVELLNKPVARDALDVHQNALTWAQHDILAGCTGASGSTFNVPVASSMLGCLVIFQQVSRAQSTPYWVLGKQSKNAIQA